MKKGDELRVFHEIDSPPKRSMMTLRMAAAIAAGYQPAENSRGEKKAFEDEIETLEGGGTRRTTAWTWKADHKVTFRTMQGAESLSISEFMWRLTNREWCEANPDHPITLIAATIFQYEILLKKLGMTEPDPETGMLPMYPHIIIRRGKGKKQRKYYMPAHWNDEQIEEEIERLNKR